MYKKDIKRPVESKQVRRKALVIKGKLNVVPVLFLAEHHAMKAYWGSGV
jgi:hypothetical protein